MSSPLSNNVQPLAYHTPAILFVLAVSLHLLSSVTVAPIISTIRTLSTFPSLPVFDIVILWRLKTTISDYRVDIWIVPVKYPQLEEVTHALLRGIRKNLDQESQDL
jgi:hypothetical protein